MPKLVQTRSASNVNDAQDTDFANTSSVKKERRQYNNRRMLYHSI